MKNRITCKINLSVIFMIFCLFAFLLSGCGIVDEINEKKAEIVDELYKQDARFYDITWEEAKEKYLILEYIPKLTDSIDCLEEGKEGITINYKAVQDYKELCKEFDSVIGEMGYNQYYDHKIGDEFSKAYHTNLIIDGKEVKKITAQLLCIVVFLEKN
ncbi:MAG: hypothetical protein GX234_04160 [Clostridiales bacterium]|nr:hypothetical protein [Clostridiales bacterium]